MLRKYFSFSIAIVLIYLLSICVLAHPGNTDASGGHINKSTGEYHYHHGYPEHDHRDMDGDGDLDCPYKFKDATDHSSSKASSESNYIKSSSVKSEADTPSKEVITVPDYIYWIIGSLVMAIILLICTIVIKDKEFKEKERKYISLEEEYKSRVEQGINDFHKALVNKYGKDYLYDICDAPDGDFIDCELLPHSSEALSGSGIDRYVFYFGGARSWNAKYHHKHCRFAALGLPVNAMNLQQSRYYIPCALCKSALPKTEWVARYLKRYEFLKQYIDFDHVSPKELERIAKSRNRSGLRDKF